MLLWLVAPEDAADVFCAPPWWRTEHITLHGGEIGHADGVANLPTMQGVVKIYDPTTGAGVVVLDQDQSEVYLRAGSLAGSVFRLLRQGQRINFDVEEEDGRRFIHSVKVGSEGR